MRLPQLYDGRRFPEYFYESCLASVILTLPGHPKEREMLYFPCTESKIARALRRLEVEQPEQCVATLDTSEISEAVCGVFEDEYPLNEHLETLNALTDAFKSSTVRRLRTSIQSLILFGRRHRRKSCIWQKNFVILLWFRTSARRKSMVGF